MTKDSLGTRIKTFYEEVSKTKLVRRMPVAIRLDGKAFHTFTRGFVRPFDYILTKTMQKTMLYLCENIQGCVLGYTQSDEITLILKDYTKLESSAWFDYEVQKMCSISASMATMIFNKIFTEHVNEYIGHVRDNTKVDDDNKAYIESLKKAVDKGAMFDARVFNIPREEVTNLIYWRQLDATRNSIQMVGQANFSHKELQHKSCNDIQNMLLTQKNINWNNYATEYKRGSCCVKNKYLRRPGIFDSAWVIDTDIPIFKGEDRNYIEQLLLTEEEELSVTDNKNIKSKEEIKTELD